jgi:hypothetical protein
MMPSEDPMRRPSDPAGGGGIVFLPLVGVGGYLLSGAKQICERAEASEAVPAWLI